ncbi:MAG: VWA domain-containing protein [Deltaproteobacteria bacterium]|nr:MAG: VWA domain-containing protein [Deltaproteobacteria bacterium]
MSFLAPLGLLAGLLAVPLIALYILKIRRKKVVVPSILLWQELAQRDRLATPFERFRRNLLLWIQLLLLALIVLALARPVLPLGPGTGEAAVILVDVTASMAATDVRPNRLGQAVSQAERMLDSMSSGTEAALVVAGPRTEVIVPYTQELGRIRRALRSLSAVEAEGSLREGLQLGVSLARARDNAVVHVFSDGGGASLSDLTFGSTPVRYHRIGQATGNAGIVALDLRSSPSQAAGRQLFVTAQRFGGPVEATVSVFLDEELLGLRNATLADDPVSLVFDLPSGASGVVRAELSADDDHLPIDNVAWALVEPERRRRVLAVGTDPFTTHALSVDRRVALTVREPGEVTDALLRMSDAVFLGTPIDLDLDGVNVAFLGPQTGGPVHFADPLPRPEVISWRRTHPVLRLLSLEMVQISELHPTLDAMGLEPLVSTSAGPLLLGGERTGARILQLSVRPVRSDLPLRVAWPVLLFNAVGWLTENAAGAAHGHVITTGKPWSIRTDVEPSALEVLGPDGEPRPFHLSERLLRVQDTLDQGIYRVRLGGRRLAFAANLLSPVESDIAPRRSLELGASATPEGERQASISGGQEVWRWLLMGALLILVAEWVVWAQRGRL